MTNHERRTDSEFSYNEYLGFLPGGKLRANITPGTHLELFADPKLKYAWNHNPRNYDITAFCFVSKLLAIEGFLDLAQRKIPLEETVRWQMRHVAVREAFYTEWIDNWPNGERQDRGHILSNPYVRSPRYHDSQLSAQYGDLWVNTLLVLDTMPFKNPQLGVTDLRDLEDFAIAKQIGLNYDTLHVGLANLVRSDTLQLMLDAAIVTSSEIDEVISPQTAKFMRQIAETETFSSPRMRRDFTMYPFGDLEAGLPPLEFLPHLTRETIIFLANIPQNIKERKVYPPSDMQRRVDDVSRFARFIVDGKIAQGTLDDYDRIAIQATQIYWSLAYSLINYYKQPGNLTLWDRRDDSQFVPEPLDLPSVSGLRELIRKHGGDAKKHVNIQVKHKSDLSPGRE